MSRSIAIVGAGIFGVTTAIALRRRGHEVAIYDPGPLPHPLAASTDISKVVRMEYGADEGYMALMERALDGWRRWNEDPGGPLFHETGVTFLCSGEMAPGGFEHESFQLLLRRGHRPERLDRQELRRRFRAFRAADLDDGFFHRLGGFACSGRAVERLIAQARALGVALREEAVARLLRAGGDPAGRVTGVATASGEWPADDVVVAGGAWTGKLVPEVAAELRPTGQPVFHLVPANIDRAPFLAGALPVFGADISRTGYYGFPLLDGVVKIAHHGAGLALDPDGERVVTAEQEAHLRRFLGRMLPDLQDAPLASTRLCFYCDTWDGHFLIDRIGEGLVVAAGGSGHAFKFAPVLGDLIADACEGGTSRPSALPFGLADRFRRRPERSRPAGGDAARAR